MGITKGLSLEESCFQYLNLRKRLVDSVPREIHISKEFVCPAELQEGLELVIDKIKNGENLIPHS
ncbi:hypothetical protein B0I26_11912 [Anoxybacillus vitaminiphilus]|uniref:Uncharacterized protein n=2 Tax=Paranoxybacillus vitaminiphilus TaxID=581036 RepID=A0A327Y5J6_9BACL|nr:hypothetical protein B0I26_11912 [Anoxybacillus vitaminiphilus]